MKSRYAAVFRLLVPLYSGLNLTLFACGYDPLPFETTEVETAVLAVLSIASTVYAWWKNNNLTHPAEQAQDYLNQLKKSNIREK